MKAVDLNRLLFDGRLKAREDSTQAFMLLCSGERRARLPLGERLVEDGLLRKATLSDYMLWLREYLKRQGAGGLYFYGGPFSTEAPRFFVALKDIALPELNDREGLSIIVPAGISVKLPPQLPHERRRVTLFLMDGFTCVGWPIFVFSDICF